MTEPQGAQQYPVTAWIGLALGLAAGAYIFWIGQEKKHGREIAEKEQPSSVRLLTLFHATAEAITKARLIVWKLAPPWVRPRVCQLLRSRYSPASKVNRLFLIRHSNFSEKIRWALELSGENFHEVNVAIFAERPTALYHSLGASDKLPLIFTSEGHGGVKDPTAVIQKISQARWRDWMYPEGARELEDSFERNFGQSTMNVAYAFLLQEGMLRETVDMLSRGLPLWQRLLVPSLGVGAISTLNRRFDFAENVPANMKVIDKAFRMVERIIADGRLYLCGESISVADIAFASLAFPVLLPDETAENFVSYDPRTLPRGYVEIIKSLRAREAGRFVLRLYRTKRWRGGRVTPTAGSPRRGRSFTLKKNINSPSHSRRAGREKHNATITGGALPLQLPKDKFRATFGG